MSEHCIVVAVANPASAEPLTRMGCTLAKANDGTLRITSVPEVPAQLPTAAYDEVAPKHEAIVERGVSIADAVGVDAEGVTPPSREPARSIVALVENADAAGLLMGARELVPFKQSLLGRTVVETAMERVACEVYVEQVGPTPPVPGDSVLVPVAEGAHADAVVRVASDVAAVHEMRVHLVTVVDPDAGVHEIERTERRLRAEADADVGSPVDVEVVPGETVVGTLADLTDDHDLTVLGATADSTIEQFLAGSVPTGLARRSRNTLLLVDSGP